MAANLINWLYFFVLVLVLVDNYWHPILSEILQSWFIQQLK